MGRVFITGDIHGKIVGITKFCRENNTHKEDTFILLGDVGINYFLNYRDVQVKRAISFLPITLFCVRGNHEMRPEHLAKTHYELYFGNRVIVEDEYPNIKYAIDGFDYDINGYHTLVVGGAYSVDKQLRLEKGWSWFEDEQLNSSEQTEILDYIDWLNKNASKINIVLTHTCPISWEPRELFMSCVDQTSVDKSMETFLGTVEFNLKDYDMWYFGHYHGNKNVTPKSKMLFDEVVELKSKGWSDYEF